MGLVRSAAIGRCGPPATVMTPTLPVGVERVAAAGNLGSVRAVNTRPVSHTRPLRRKLGRSTTLDSTARASLAKYSVMLSSDRRWDRRDKRLSSACDGLGTGSSVAIGPGRNKLPTTRIPAATAARAIAYLRLIWFALRSTTFCRGTAR